MARLERIRPTMNIAQIAQADQKKCEQIEEALNSLTAAVAAIAAAQAAADAANTAAAAADTAAANAQTTADDITSSTSLQNSWVTGVTITGTDAGANATVTISAHTRHYPQPDGTTVDVAVSGGSVTALAYSTAYVIYYVQASRAGGAVTYLASTSDVAQIGDTHVVGSVVTPAAAAGPTGGGYVRGPGQGSIA